jgi:hypothetical protein
MEKKITYISFMNLCLQHPANDFELQVQNYSFNILQNLLNDTDCSKFFVGEMGQQSIDFFSSEFDKD